MKRTMKRTMTRITTRTSMRLFSLSAVALLTGLAMTGCASRPAYYVAPPPPAYAPSFVQAAEQNGFADGFRIGRRDRDSGHSYSPAYNERYANTPGYDPRLGGDFGQYRHHYRDGFRRGYHDGYARG